LLGLCLLGNRGGSRLMLLKRRFKIRSRRGYTLSPRSGLLGIIPFQFIPKTFPAAPDVPLYPGISRVYRLPRLARRHISF